VRPRALLTASIWKANASKKIGPVSTKERQSIEYRQKLVDKWSTAKDVRSVAERRFVPASIHNTTKLKRDMIEAQKTKEDRRRSHSRAGKDKPKAERKSESFRLCHCIQTDVSQRLSSRSKSKREFTSRNAIFFVHYTATTCILLRLTTCNCLWPTLKRWPSCVPHDKDHGAHTLMTSTDGRTLFTRTAAVPSFQASGCRLVSFFAP
jgi:hypothetical protein